MSKIDAFIFDIDGTVANSRGIRSPYDYSKVHLDTPRKAPIQVVRFSVTAGLYPLAVSGRPDSCKESTIKWIDEHVFDYCSVYSLFMRKTKEEQGIKDFIVKKRIYEEEIEPFYNIHFVLDDRNQVVDMWRAVPLDCFQVQPGDF